MIESKKFRKCNVGSFDSKDVKSSARDREQLSKSLTNTEMFRDELLN